LPDALAEPDTPNAQTWFSRLIVAGAIGATLGGYLCGFVMARLPRAATRSAIISS